jgi:hypothetical protein
MHDNKQQQQQAQVLNCGQNKVNATGGGSSRYDSIMNNPQQLG